ncbi:MAG: ABC transporter substrate-binding protein [Sulfolobales archaeon]|nr:ABC transporter substrate-binding protein [Sulfolobales archaeon]
MTRASIATSFALIIIVAVSTALPITALALGREEVVVKQRQWPWGNASEPYPWLEYLKNLTTVRGIRLIVLTRHDAVIQTRAKTDFLNSQVAKELGIVDIIYDPAGPGLWIDEIERRKAQGIPIDVAWGGGPTLFNLIYSKGYLMALDPSSQPAVNAILYEASKIPDVIAGASSKLYGPGEKIYWVGAAISSFGFTVNLRKLSEYGLPQPNKWIDLGKPEYARYLPALPLITIANPLMSTSNTRIYEIILQSYGWEEGWRVLTLLAANSRIMSSSDEVRDFVIRGDAVAGITIDFYGYIAEAQNPDCKYVIPEGESIVNADPIAVLKDTRYPVHAAAFVAWVLSEYGGQRVWLDRNINRLPINERVFNLPEGRERPELEKAYRRAVETGGIPFDEDLASATELAMQYYFKATLIDAQTDLVSTWAAIARAFLEGRITVEEFNYLTKKLGEPVTFRDPITNQDVKFTLNYAKEITPKIIEKEFAATLNTLLQRWREAASAKYLSVYQELQVILTSPKTTPPTSPPPTTETPPTTTPTTTPPTPTTPPEEGTPTITQPGVPLESIATIVIIIVIVGAMAAFLLRRK